MSSSPLLLLLLFLLFAHLACAAQAQVDDVGATRGVELMSEPLDWASATSAYPFVDLEVEDEEGGAEADGGLGGSSRRALFWRIHYYISYGALSANRIPCPPRSGRSYYTHNCYRARGPPRPYHRSCSAIARCKSW